jgi:hypothetical protein
MNFESKPQAAPVTFDHDSIREFYAAYIAATVAKRESFVFDKHEYVTRYAYYLIQYLGPQLGMKVKEGK